ncbi:glycosyltransferase family 9 protein [Quadrisphaera sp. DSM 44207]|uniref:glycosyltransferase family 9 protein n=1 Tax=Quadrisphaera sp. DSM 44207 TaxID=1881057 RepID=UPI00088A4FE1|nr:glycosyltransferase family 9 protein [Quadrisphaera sp. DSM 44207]SDQ04052.1 ADP-heptose:LPS heptosyltransferase [Quadrisphaera sp. DSM 44207]
MTGADAPPATGRGLRVLAVRLDSDGDVLLTGPAVAALRTGPDGAPAARVDLLASPQGAGAARLLPGVDDVLVFDAPWSGYRPAPLDPGAVTGLVELLRERAYDECVVFTSFHQSPLPTALLARLAGVARVAGASEDYPGSLLDVRHRRGGGADGSGGGHEVLAALRLVAATGRAVPRAPRLAVRRPLPDVAALVPPHPYVVVHPGASVPSRAPSPHVARAAVTALRARGWAVAVTGGPAETALTGAVAAGTGAADLSGRTDLPSLAAVLAGAAACVVGNTGPAHLAAAVGTPVVSLFSPVVPAERWAPWGVPSVLLGDQDAPCRLTRARECPEPGHPCLDVEPSQVVAAVARLAAGAAHPPRAAAPALSAEGAPA